MNLNHIDLQVSDVSAARRFFEEHFGLRCIFQRREQLAILRDDAGLEFGVSNLFDSPPAAYPTDFHIGFILDTESNVRAIPWLAPRRLGWIAPQLPSGRDLGAPSPSCASSPRPHLME